jgi:glycosyltransferase involved in cell wall biosynthesis
VAILFYRFGPYHHARLKAAGACLQVSGVEFSNVDPIYAWDVVETADGFKRLTLFSETKLNELPTRRILSRVGEALDEVQPQVVAIPGWYDRCSLAALQWCAAHGIPVVVMSETTAWDVKRKWLREALKRRLIKLCATGLVGGRPHADYLERLGIERNKIFFGYDVVDNRYFENKAAEIRNQKSVVSGQKSEISGQRSGVNSQKEEARNRSTSIGLQPPSPQRGEGSLPQKYFLASARFVGKKNLARLIEAYALYRALARRTEIGDRRSESGKQKAEDRDQKSEVSGHVVGGPIVPWSLVLLGDGPLKSDLCRLISDLRLDGYVHLPGFKQYHELPVYYGLASAFIHASTTEQWGLVVNEAMASGLPVLVSNRCGCATDLLKDGVNGFIFDPYNVEQLAQLMLKISAFNFPLSEFGLASRQIVQDWSLERFAANLKAACELAISHHQPKKRHLAGGILNLMLHLPRRVFIATDEGLDAIRNPGPALNPRVKVAPNFFIIGAPKSGTTSLSEYLKDHPNVFFSPVKEPHFFDLDTSKRLKLKLGTYLSLFSQADPNVHKAIGEGSTGYLFSKVAVSEILKFNPDSRFIVMLRNPVELVWSWHAEMYFEGVENVYDFEEAWKLEKERRNGKNIPKACWEPQKLFYSEWGKLGDQMERLFSVVPRDRVKVILFDDFAVDTKGVYEDVLSFLGVPSDGRNDFQTANENKAIRYPWLQQRLAVAANNFRLVRAVSGLKLNLGIGLSKKLLLLNSKPSNRAPISPELRAELVGYFCGDVQKLSKLLNRDLSHWV